VSAFSREHEKDSYRLSWGAEHLDNVVLTSTLLQSGLVGFIHIQKDKHTHLPPLSYTRCVSLFKAGIALDATLMDHKW